MRWVTGVLVCALIGSSAEALAQNNIREWGGMPGIVYDINQRERTVLIQSAGTFKFEATDGPNLGSIEWIKIDPSVVGTVNLYVSREPGGIDGALFVDAVNLSSQATTNIMELRVANVLGSDDKVASTAILGPVSVGDRIAHPIETQTLGGDISCTFMRDLTVSAGTIGPPYPNITVRDGYVSTIFVNGSLGNVSIDTNMAGAIHATADVASLAIGQALGGAVLVDGSLGGGRTGDLTGTLTTGADLGPADFTTWGLSGDLTVGRDLLGLLWLSGMDAEGELVVGGNVTVDGYIHCQQGGLQGHVFVGQDMDGTIQASNPFGDLLGWIHIAGSLSGQIAISGRLYDPGQQDLSGGHIQINGSLKAPARITVALGFHGLTEYIVADFDGLPKEDIWEPGALVTVAGVEYRWDYQVPRIWESRCSKGDLNNDNQVDNYDIDPFVLALTDETAYALAYPGMSGSRVYHGNCNCQDGFDNFDIDAFTLRLTDPAAYYEQYPDCEQCLTPPGGAGEGMSAQAVGELYKKSVAPQRLPYVIDAAEFLAGWYKGTPRGKFWADVRAALVK